MKIHRKIFNEYPADFEQNMDAPKKLGRTSHQKMLAALR